MFLQTHSYFSLRYGTMSPEDLAAAAAGSGVSHMAMTDRNNTSAMGAFLRACAEKGIHGVAGIAFCDADQQLRYVGLARNQAGWKSLCALLTQHGFEDQPVGARAPELENVWFIYPGKAPVSPDLLRPEEFIGVRAAQLSTLHSSGWMPWRHKLVAWSPVVFIDEEHWKVHKLLRAIDYNTLLGKLEPSQLADPDDRLYSLEAMRDRYALYPDLLERAQQLLESCQLKLGSTAANNRQTFTGSKEGDAQLLEKLALEGCRRRYGEAHQQARERTLKELKVIRQLDFPAYFLITWDIIRYAQNAGYHHVGRGSGANSIVAYNIGITDVDPIELDLYFERFINPYRASPPDFDIDFSWDERDEVTDYIFKRYGREHTALLATYVTFKGRSIVRELGKVLGLPKEDIDLIVNEPLATDRHHPWARHIFHYGKYIENFPNYLGIHAGGIIISERPLNEHVALQMPPKGFPIAQFDMYHAEDLGFHKYDILSQRGLGHIKEAVERIRKNRGIRVDVHDIPALKRDEQVARQLRSGRCMGCFYIESPAMRGLLSKMRCGDYLHLVAASSIIRPGVAKSGMMREYLWRFHHPEQVVYLHSTFREHLGETYGVMVYQEDVMKIVHHFAGLDLDECDVLRRIMSGKKRSQQDLERIQGRYLHLCRQRGYPEALIQEVWRQVESFSGYSFSKAHSASYAVESYQSLYLKTYYPLEFMTAVINNFGGFYRTEYYVHEARMAGARIHAPCVNHSTWLTTLLGDDLYLGLVHIKGMEEQVARRVVHEREYRGPYRSLGDLMQRVPAPPDQLDLLIRIGALRFTGMSKAELMWAKNALLPLKGAVVGGAQLFEDPEEAYFTLPPLETGKHDQAYDELELLGFPLCNPFELADTDAHVWYQRVQERCVRATSLPGLDGRQVYLLGYYVCRKDVTTVKRELMNFGTWIDQDGAFFDTVHFPQSLERFPWRGKGIYLIRGKVVLDMGFPSVEVDWMDKLAWRTG